MNPHRLRTVIALLVLAMTTLSASAQATRPAHPLRDRLMGRLAGRGEDGPARGVSWGVGVPRGVKAYKDLEYTTVGTQHTAAGKEGAIASKESATAGKTPLRLDLYVPESAPRPMPVVVWIHGGGWQLGTKDRCPALPLTARGYAAASIDYRLTDVAPWPAQIYDCKAAIRWLRAHAKEYGLDPDRIGVWGASAGGHLVAMLGTSAGAKELEGDEGNLNCSSRVQAVCDWFGPSDFVALGDLLKAAGLGDNAKGPITKLLGGPLTENMDKARQASPVTWISKDDAPFLIMHGDQDRLVPPSQSEILYKRLKEAGVDATLYIVKGAGHGQGGFGKPEALKMVADFFDRTLKGTATTRPE
jgi:acetyl esterase/lipase